jgi:catechol 2,3-dioxygenase-like lactoylglutathione lyase family enzyme
MLTHVDHLVLAVPDLEMAAAPFERLGLRLSPATRHEGAGTANRALFVGRENQFYVELLAVHDAAVARRTGRGDYLAIAESGGGAARLVFGCDDLDAADDRCARRNVTCERRAIVREGGDRIADVLIPDSLGAGCPVGMIAYETSQLERAAAREARGLLAHDLPLTRLDHLAVIAPQLDETVAFWAGVLGVPVHGEVRGRGMVIKQMKLGNAIVELLGPETPESPLASRPAGLIAMAAYEVPDLAAAVATARERGFTLPDPAEGVLPGTRVATIGPDQMGGLSLQLLEYV